MVNMEFSIIRNNKEIKLIKEEIDDFQQKYEKYKIADVGIKWLTELIECNFKIILTISNKNTRRKLNIKENTQQTAYISNYLTYCYLQNKK